jgi:S-formylglutathione hydrolase
VTGLMPSDSRLERFSLESQRVPSPVEVAVLTPASQAGGPLPLLLLLHGGGGSADNLERLQPDLEHAWSRGELAPCIVATPSCQRSFYLDTFDGSESWETFLLEELIPALRGRCPVETNREGTLLSGISMGGMGALRLAFKYPERFAAVAVLEPGIEPALAFAEIPLRDRLYRELDYMQTRYGKPIDEPHWQANNPANIARTNAAAIADSGLTIYFECGDADSLFLHHGAEFLHRVLWDAGISHEYRLLRGADHLGSSLVWRTRDMLAFLGRHLDPPPADIEQPRHPLALFQQERRQSWESQGYVPSQTRLVNAHGSIIETVARGEGPTIVLLPSLGRGAEDFDDLAMGLARGGFRSVCPEPRSIGASAGSLDDLTLHDLAADVAAVVEYYGAPAVVLGHAFGNRVARTLASDRPDLVSHVVLLACGGKVHPAPEVHSALLACFNPMLSASERLGAVNVAFFADGNDPAVWIDGWYPELARGQMRAVQATGVDEWWPAGGKPMLVVQGMQDVTALPANAELLREQFPDRVSIYELEGAGHAMLPERPAEIATAVLGWLKRRMS